MQDHREIAGNALLLSNTSAAERLEEQYSRPGAARLMAKYAQVRGDLHMTAEVFEHGMMYDEWKRSARHDFSAVEEDALREAGEAFNEWRLTARIG